MTEGWQALLATAIALVGALLLFVAGAWLCLLCQRCGRHYFAWGNYCHRCEKIMKGHKA